jgi:peptidyl-prolyl cis-trans isomerase D
MQVLVRAKMFANEKGAFNEEAFNNYLRQNEYTEASFMEEVRRNLTAQKYRQFVQEMSVVSANAAEVDYRLNESKLDVEYLKFDAAVSAVAISDEDATKFAAAKDGQVKIKEYFDRHQNEFKQAPKVHARHILVSFDGARAATEAAKKRTKDEAKKRADEVFAKAKLAGADFNGLAAEYTDEASGKTRGGDLGFFTREAMVKEFSDKAFAMKVGEVSPPVETPFGWHVIKVEAIQEAKNTTLAEATTSIARKLLETEKRASALDGQVKAILASLQKGEDVAATLSTMNVSWTATGGFSPGSGYVPGVGSDKALLSAIGGMSTSKPLAPEVVTVGGTKYILRLKSRTDADMAKFAGSERDRAHKTVEYAQAYGTLQAVEKRLRDDLEKRNRIWLNPEFLAIDDRRAKGQVNAADGGTDEI